MDNNSSRRATLVKVRYAVKRRSFSKNLCKCSGYLWVRSYKFPLFFSFFLFSLLVLVLFLGG